jgi:hypothetical protein
MPARQPVPWAVLIRALAVEVRQIACSQFYLTIRLKKMARRTRLAWRYNEVLIFTSVPCHKIPPFVPILNANRCAANTRQNLA